MIRNIREEKKLLLTAMKSWSDLKKNQSFFLLMNISHDTLHGFIKKNKNLLGFFTTPGGFGAQAELERG